VVVTEKKITKVKMTGFLSPHGFIVGGCMPKFSEARRVIKVNNYR
jgi:hypothetical protein